MLPWVVSATMHAVLALACVFLILRVRGLQRQLDQSLAAVQMLRDDFGALTAGAVGVGDRQARLEQRIKRLRERQDQFELQEPGSQPYAQAIRMVRKGADVEELVSTCGLTRGEAELIVMVHRMDEAS